MAHARASIGITNYVVVIASGHHRFIGLSITTTLVDQITPVATKAI